MLLLGYREIAKTHTGMTNQNHLVIIPGAPVKYMSGDVPYVVYRTCLIPGSILVYSFPFLRYRFHQNPDLLYLCGIQEPDAVLVLESSSGQALPEHKSTLYVKPRDPFRFALISVIVERAIE